MRMHSTIAITATRRAAPPSAIPIYMICESPDFDDEGLTVTPRLPPADEVVTVVLVVPVVIVGAVVIVAIGVTVVSEAGRVLGAPPSGVTDVGGGRAVG